MGRFRRVPWYAVPLAIFAATRLIDGVLIVLLARHQVPASALPTDQLMPTLVDPHTYTHVIANWDGQWYRAIAAHGYPRHLPVLHGVVQQNAWAFYPGFPALVWVAMRTGVSFGVAASVVSLTAGGAAMCVLYRMIQDRSSDYLAMLTVLALCCAPAAPAFQVAYTESLGLLLLLLSLVSLEQRQYGRMFLVGLALALTRPITLPLAVVVAAQFLLRWRRRREEPFPTRERWTLAVISLALLSAAGLWPLITGVAVGDLSAYAKSQHAWRTIAGNRPDTWLTSMVHGAPLGRWFVVAVVVGLLVLVAARSRERWTWGTRVWTVAYPVFILAATPATSSVLRYLLLLGPAWWPATRIRSSEWSTAQRVAVPVTVALVGLASQVWWLSWYFLILPSSHGFP
ncbi:MAG: hypothetical protein WAV00_11830 [Nocardioides sp.]